MQIKKLSYSFAIGILLQTGQMNISKIHFKEVIEILKNDFGMDIYIQETKYRQILDIPFLIEAVQKLMNTELKWYPIPNWYEFEYKDFEYSNNEIVQLFYPMNNLLHENMILITMESYIPQMAFEIKNSIIFEIFIEEYEKYSEQHLPFMQNMDYIALFPKVRTIVIIHHEGYTTMINKASQN